MQNPNTNSNDKVVNLFARRQTSTEKTDTTEAASTEDGADSESFSDSMRKNAENADRLRRERLKANQSVLKSYRIKN